VLNVKPASPVGHRRSLFIAFALFLLASHSLFPQTCRLLTAVRETVNQITPFSVAFTQQVYYDQELSIEESGIIKFQDVKKIRWEYRDPDLKIAVINGDQYKFYEEESNQVTIGKINASNKKWIWQLLFADEISNAVRCDEDKKIIYIKDPSADMDFEVYVGEGNMLSKVVHRDPTGALNVYIFSDYHQKIALTDADFTIETPGNVEVIQAEDF